jgi:diacylglycerol kinase family enzyme
MILVVANPYSGAGPNRRRVDALVAALGAAGMAARIVWEPAARAAALADGGAMRGCRAVVAAGGDGTVSHVVNEIPAAVPLAVLPLGNENLFARALGFGGDPAALARAVAAGRTRAIDLGRARADGRSRRFALMASAGFDAVVVHRFAAWRARGDRLRRVRRLHYLRPIAAAVLGGVPARVRLTTPAGTHEGAHCLIANVPGYALDARVTPGASADDGRLDWVLLERPGRLPLLAYAWAILRGRHLARADVRAGQASRVTLAADTPVPVQLDGDPWGTTPVQVDVVPHALTVVVSG